MCFYCYCYFTLSSLLLLLLLLLLLFLLLFLFLNLSPRNNTLCHNLFAVTESWLTSEDSSATEKLAGISDTELLADLPYTCYRTDRADGRKGGGVLLVVKNSCMTSRRCDLERATLEMVVIEIQSANNTNVIAAVFYRPPDSIDRFF